eukprot:gnl/TRDRNA2_/TRDRNA2_149949_c0_seq1.p1 gnl/TRDRNA2_/TRDRNA2_149949_c0~~gnl/TRDRNA2_/TRDRNA2_149949_c0_seq1.p1  ORF type:complete len:325 (+),score=41.49 gnl/TRDRNA2_/TRDRNA2_149949_c0_seq1:112-975(+)
MTALSTALLTGEMPTVDPAAPQPATNSDSGAVMKGLAALSTAALTGTLGGTDMAKEEEEEGENKQEAAIREAFGGLFNPLKTQLESMTNQSAAPEPPPHPAPRHTTPLLEGESSQKAPPPPPARSHMTLPSSGEHSQKAPPRPPARPHTTPPFEGGGSQKASLAPAKAGSARKMKPRGRLWYVDACPPQRRKPQGAPAGPRAAYNAGTPSSANSTSSNFVQQLEKHRAYAKLSQTWTAAMLPVETPSKLKDGMLLSGRQRLYRPQSLPALRKEMMDAVRQSLDQSQT